MREMHAQKTFWCRCSQRKREAGSGIEPVRNSHGSASSAVKVYSRGLDLTDPGLRTPIGLGCKVCERRGCPQRAFPSLRHPLRIDENVRGVTLYATGMRISELVGLNIEDFDLAERWIRVRGKGRKERSVPYGVPAAAALDGWLGQGRPAVRRHRRSGRRRFRGRRDAAAPRS